jgi:hypothetical protein
LPAARRVNRATGQIERWAIAELSLTPTPAEPRMMERPVAEVAAAFKAVGLELTDDIADASKVGRRLSKRQLEKLGEARQTIDDLVRWASYDDAEPAGADELDGKSVISAPATEHGNTASGEGAADAASGPEDGQPANDDLTLNDILIEMERLALLNLEV